MDDPKSWVGYLVESPQRTVYHDPGEAAICPICDKELGPLTGALQRDVHRTGDGRVFFYRIHKACWRAENGHHLRLVDGYVQDDYEIGEAFADDVGVITKAFLEIGPQMFGAAARTPVVAYMPLESPKLRSGDFDADWDMAIEEITFTKVREELPGDVGVFRVTVVGKFRDTAVPVYSWVESYGY